MKRKGITSPAIVLCIVAALAGAVFFVFSQYQKDRAFDFNVIRKMKKKVKRPIAPNMRNPQNHVSQLGKVDDYTIAMNHLRNLQHYIQTKNWNQALVRNPDFSIVMGRMPQQQRDAAKLKLLDIVEPVFRTGDPHIANQLITRACMQPSHAINPIALSKRMAGIAEILINRMTGATRSTVWSYSNRINYYLRTSQVFLNEQKYYSLEKEHAKQRIKYLRKKLNELKKRPL